MITRAAGPTAKNSRLMGKFTSFVSPIRAETLIAIESGQNDEGTYSYFVRVRTANVVTYEEGWSSVEISRERGILID